jgi:hypothetical protein
MVTEWGRKMQENDVALWLLQQKSFRWSFMVAHNERDLHNSMCTMFPRVPGNLCATELSDGLLPFCSLQQTILLVSAESASVNILKIRPEPTWKQFYV